MRVIHNPKVIPDRRITDPRITVQRRSYDPRLLERGSGSPAHQRTRTPQQPRHQTESYPQARAVDGSNNTMPIPAKRTNHANPRLCGRRAWAGDDRRSYREPRTNGTI